MPIDVSIRVGTPSVVATVKRSWVATIAAAIRLGNVDAAYALTVAYVRRLRELGLGL